MSSKQIELTDAWRKSRGYYFQYFLRAGSKNNLMPPFSMMNGSTEILEVCECISMLMLDQEYNERKHGATSLSFPIVTSYGFLPLEKPE